MAHRGPIPTDELRLLQKRLQAQAARKREHTQGLLKRSGAGGSNVVNAEAGTRGQGGGAGSGKPRASSEEDDSDCEIVQAESGAGGHRGGAGSGKPRASSEEDDSDCEIVDPQKRQKRTHVPGRKLCLFDPRDAGNTDLQLPEMIVRLIGGKGYTIQVETTIPLEDLSFIPTEKVECKWDDKNANAFTITPKHGDTFYITAEACATEMVQLHHKPTGMVIGTVRVPSHLPEIAPTNQQSADTDRGTYLATLGLLDDASESDIIKAYKEKMRLLHPDKTGDSSEEAMKKIHQVQTAYHALMDKG